MEDDLNIHDGAADKAERSIQDLNKLMEEGIPERIERIRAELFNVLEACWLTGSVQWCAIRTGNLDEETLDHALKIYQYTAGAESYVMTAINALEVLTTDRVGKDVDEVLAVALGGMSSEWIRDYFIGTYQDDEREIKVQRLNAVLRFQKLMEEE
jgi:L-alanine-DL-glutamate epimerase-like enolase superfamily enzyme